MSKLNLPTAKLIIKAKTGKTYVYDRLRKQYVRLTPEEEVRQSFVSFLIEYKGYPEGLLANEVCIELGKLARRCDTVLYDKHLRPVMIIEFKAPTIEITQDTFDQLARYNHVLNVPWLVISNGLSHYCCARNEEGGYSFVKEIPDFQEL
jgi:Type I site-specific restriction-modification system, R (restriction) subunit and related helicases